MSKKYTVTVQPRARRDAVAALDADQLKVQTTKPAVDGAANTSVIKLLAAYLGVKKSQILIISGEKSRQKTVLVTD